MYRYRKNLRSRFRWSIFGNLSDIEVVTGIDEHGQPLRTPLFEHSIAAEPLTEPPVSKLRVHRVDVLHIIETNEFDMDINIEDLEYKTLIIETENGSPITIGEFVAQAHEHLNEFKRIIIELKCFRIHGTSDDERLARIGVSKEDIKVYFKYALSRDFTGDLTWGLVTFA
jgi:hypothetical protein